MPIPNNQKTGTLFLVTTGAGVSCLLFALCAWIWPGTITVTGVIGAILACVTIVLLILCPVAIIYTDFRAKKMRVSGAIAALTLISYTPPLLQRKTYDSPICTCCDRYLIPEDVMAYLLIVAVILTIICYIQVGVYTFFIDCRKD